MFDPKRRVVVTGIGAYTPLGKNVPETYGGLLMGHTGISQITSFDTSGFATTIAGEIHFDPLQYFESKEARQLDRLAQLGIIAADEALSETCIPDGAKGSLERAGVIIGVGAVGFHTTETQIQVLHTKGPRRVSPHALVMFQPDAVTGAIARRFKLRGPSQTVNSACSSGSDAIKCARASILLGEADLIVTGGIGAEITPFGLATFGQMRALSTRNGDPAGASRPFSEGRDGFVLGEGAVILVLESLDSAQRHGVPILAEIIGCGQTTDTYHPTEPDPQGSAAVQAMRIALADAGIAPEGVDLISTHGTGTVYNDSMEAAAIREVFESASAYPLVNATKSMAGHLIGGAGPLGALSVIESMVTGRVHPTRNLSIPDKGCELNHVLQEQEARINIGMVNAFGFQGHNTVLLFRRYVP